MPERFTLVALSFSLILHNVCSWDVSEPLNHTLNDDGSVSVTCVFYGEGHFQLDSKLKMNHDELVCEVSTSQGNGCTWQHNANIFTYTFLVKNPEKLHKKEFFCEISRISPLPVTTKSGPKTKLFRGCSHHWVPKSCCSCSNQTVNEPKDLPEDRTSSEVMNTTLICGLLIVVVMLLLYSIILTVLYIRLKVKNSESSDTLTYVPMQRNVKRRDIDNTEYVDMREVQKRGGSHRDMNHNSHKNMITV